MMTNYDPIISIITPTYNRGDIIEKAIQSVYSQGIENLELIIMDGGSTDNTAEIVSKYPKIRFYSEKDEGLYFALNKGISLSKGKYIGWLNSDDYYNPGALHALLDLLIIDPNLTAAFGFAEVLPNDQNKKPIRIPRSMSMEKGYLHKCVFDAFPINSGLYKKSVMNELGCFDTKYSIAADKDFLFRFGINNYSLATTNQVICIYQSHSNSLTFNSGQNTGNIKGLTEEMSIALSNENLFTDKTKKALCHLWFLNASANLAIMEYSNRKIHDAWKITKRGLKYDWKWLIFFFRLSIFTFIHKILPASFLSKFRRLRVIFTE